MSCGVALAISLMLSDPNVVAAMAQPPAGPSAPVSVASEPLFADIVARSGALKSLVDGWVAAGEADRDAFWTAPDFVAFKGMTTELASLDMQGHLILKERGTDGDLKCILRGISEDIPLKVEALRVAPAADRKVALEELAYLLNDNVEVITAPPQPEA